ncbi:anaerobic ribonucleoside-triphosphate reductase activating protein [Chromatium okenii]|uniref:anaerobic ribonucleoside-triphosphate reductase activating protein n=1 Tax=Chromatium okenii TaxID=61644 RepID=UPI0032214A93
MIFCQGCAWRCRYCHNQDLLDPDAESMISWTEIMDFLSQRGELLDAVVFSGGEPTTQQALAAAMSEVRSLGFKIGLHTNGAYPERLQRLLPLLDWVGLDIKAFPTDYPDITAVTDSGRAAWQSLSVLLNSNVALEVRTTLMPHWTPEQIATLAHHLADLGVINYSLQACDTTHAFDPHLPRSAHSLTTLTAQIETTRFIRFTTRGV